MSAPLAPRALIQLLLAQLAPQVQLETLATLGQQERHQALLALPALLALLD